MEKGLPETIVDVINTEGVTCCRFNRNGTILAAGCYDGKTVLFDWNIKNVLRHGIAHSKSVAQINWNNSQDRVATASTDGFVVVWSVPEFEPVLKYNLNQHFSTINSLSFCSLNDSILLCTNNTILICKEDSVIKIAINDESLHFYGSFLHSTDDFVVTTSTGYFHLFCKGERVHSLKASNSPITQLVMHPVLNEFLFNQTDFTIRCCSVVIGDTSLQLSATKFCDDVERTKWTSAAFLNDGFFVAATCPRSITVWDAVEGRFCRKFEECPKEGISFMLAIPKSNDFITVSSYGFIYIWSKKVTENWAAYAPNFTAIEENVEYVEREDEFDIDLETGLPVAYKEQTNSDEPEENIDIGSFTKKREIEGQLTLDSLSDDEIPLFLKDEQLRCPIINFA